MQPLALTLKGFRGIRDGLGREEITLDLERLTQAGRIRHFPCPCHHHPCGILETQYAGDMCGGHFP